MKVIRRGVFETNSSSTHTITIAPGEILPPDTLPVEDGVCRIYPGEFGWDIWDYWDAATKASYALTFAYQTKSEERLKLLKEVVQAETGLPVEFVEAGDKFYARGYIDHQSDSVCAPAFVSKEALRAFIFNPKSKLHTDNDNH